MRKALLTVLTVMGVGFAGCSSGAGQTNGGDASLDIDVLGAFDWQASGEDGASLCFVPATGTWIPCALAEDASGFTHPDSSAADLGPSDVTPPKPDASDGAGLDADVDTFVPEPGEFGAPCNGNPDCFSGWCVEGPQGYICTETCTETCDAGFDCKSVLSGGSDVVFLCLPRVKKSCTPCQQDFQCTGGACLALDGSQRCAPECDTDGDCLEGYTCAADAAGEHEGTFCQPQGGSCDCTAQFDGGVRTCTSTNEAGTCYGVETCEPGTGWVGCSAAEPSAEVCDGLDNDCNALVDDGLTDGDACENSVEGVGSCAGVQVCGGGQGWMCQGPTPAAETCDFQDNDCDGLTDEDFKDADGHWTLQEHCGTCGNDCATAIPNGVGTCGGTPESLTCVVASCDPGYVRANDFQCTPPPPLGCKPCAEDADCPGGSCVNLDGQQVCAMWCGAEDQACAEGFGCTDVVDLGGETVSRCTPLSGSCQCIEANAGMQRVCERGNEFGTCQGLEVCKPDGDVAAGDVVGWVGCTAPDAAAEVCNGADDDCDLLIDDGVLSGGPCPIDLPGVGTNPNGFEVCLGSGGLQCVGPAPQAEVCDGQDNDYDGLVDEDFKGASGAYDTDANCGACG